MDSLKTLNIGKPYIKPLHDKSRLCADIRWSGRSRTIWFEVDREYEPFLCTQRVDGFLVALLPFAMMEHHNVVCSEAPLSEMLSYQINSILIPSLTSNISQFHPISIDARCDGTVLDSAHAVATGLTCGVDSFYTALKHINTGMKSFDLTHLTYFNLMNHKLWGIYGEDSSREFSNARVNYIRPAANKLGLKLVAVDSNLDVFYHNYYLLATLPLCSMGTVLALQKLFCKYYCSSSDTFSRFAFTFDDLFCCDLLTVQCISNENTTFYSTGSEVTRLEKTAYISDFDITHKYLNVCWRRLRNCTDQCDKCRRTMLALYALGKLDLFRDVFDVDAFYRHIDEYLGYMLFNRHYETHHRFHDEAYRCLAERGIPIPRSARSHARKLEVKELFEDSKESLKRIAHDYHLF
jgi:hypothetical protein